MSLIDQLLLDLPELVVPPPDVLAGLGSKERSAAVEVLARLMVKTIVPELAAPRGEAGDE